MAKRASRRATVPLEPKVSQADTIKRDRDEKLALSAALKRKADLDPTDRELAALKRYEHAQWEKAYRLVGPSIPKKLWVEWSGRQRQILDDQARLYGLPVDGATIDMRAVARWIHDHLARHGRKLSSIIGDDPLLADGGDQSPALERYREVMVRLRTLDVQEREESLLPRQSVHELLGRVAGILRTLGDTMLSRCGKEAHDAVTEALEDFERQLEPTFKEPKSS